MIQLSQLGFWMFSGALGAVGVAATVGVLDQPPKNSGLTKTALVSEQIAGSNLTKKQGDEKVARLAAKLESEPAKTSSERNSPGKSSVTPPAIIPSFDVLRVEKDGSTLIAGNAEPDSTIEIFDGVTIVATTESGSNGDFVAILEKPLPPGDHQLGIRSTGKDSKILVSADTGLVSVPIDQAGELLAMVIKPGEASRITQNPAAVKPAEKVETAKLTSVTPATKPSEKMVEITNVAPESKTEVATKKPVTAGSNAPVFAKKEIVPTPVKETVKENIRATAIVAKNETELVTKPVTKDAEQAVIKAEPTKETTPVAEAVPLKEIDAAKDQKVASLAPTKKEEAKSASKLETSPVEKSIIEPKASTKQPAVKVEPEKAPTIIVEAVEIDGPKMFIAGAAEPGRRVAVYVDNTFVGFADGSREGRFLLEVERKLSRGEHLVRADIYDAKGIAVASRAEVPLIHEPDEPAAIVARVEPAPEPDVQKPKQEETNVEVTKVEIAKVETASPVTPVAEPVKPSTTMTNKTQEKPVGKAPKKPKKAEAAKVVVAKVAENIVDKPVATKPEATQAVAEKTQPEKPTESEVIANTSRAKTPKKPAMKMAKITPAKLDEKPSNAKSAESIVKITPAPVKASTQEVKTAAQPVPEEKKELKVASAASVTAPARRVLRTGSSVIIRRGDSLWRISYRTYGRGIRYSTIYQANLSQLRSPHKIYPGQILKVPKKKFKQQG